MKVNTVLTAQTEATASKAAATPVANALGTFSSLLQPNAVGARSATRGKSQVDSDPINAFAPRKAKTRTVRSSDSLRAAITSTTVSSAGLAVQSNSDTVQLPPSMADSDLRGTAQPEQPQIETIRDRARLQPFDTRVALRTVAGDLSDSLDGATEDRETQAAGEMDASSAIAPPPGDQQRPAPISIPSRFSHAGQYEVSDASTAIAGSAQEIAGGAIPFEMPLATPSSAEQLLSPQRTGELQRLELNAAQEEPHAISSDSLASSAEQGPLGVSGPIQTGAAVAAPPNSEPGSIQPAAADAMQSGAQMARMATDAGAEHHEPFSRSAASGPGNAAQRDLGPQNASAPQAFAQFTQAHQVATSEDAAHHAAAEEHVSSVTPQTAMQHVAELNQARALQGAMRDFRVGVQTESFGRVTVQAVTEGGQLSAQLLLENSKQSAVLAAHLPGLEQRLSQQYGVNASVSLAGGWEHGSGGSTGDGGRNSESSRGAQPEDVPYARARSESSLPEEGTAVPTAMHSRYVSSILDVTV